MFFKRGDILSLICLLLAALAFYAFANDTDASQGARFAEIKVDGTVRKILPLERDTVYTLPERPDVRIAVSHGAAAFTHSNCPDKICVRSGFLSSSGQSAVCLPNKVVLRIMANGSSNDEAMDGTTH